MAPVPIPELGVEFLAKEPGRCICGQRFEEGEPIRRIGTNDFGHSLCAKGYVEVLEEHEENPDDGAESAGEDPAHAW